MNFDTCQSLGLSLTQIESHHACKGAALVVKYNSKSGNRTNILQMKQIQIVSQGYK
jgi:hypothetical protein